MSFSAQKSMANPIRRRESSRPSNQVSAQKTMKNQFFKKFTSRLGSNSGRESPAKNGSPRNNKVLPEGLINDDPNKPSIISEKELIQEAREKKKKIIELISLDFEDIRISNEAFIKLKLAEYAVSFVAAIQIGASIVQNELQQYEKKMYEEEYTLLLRLNYITTAINILLIWFRFQMHLKWSISKGYFTRIDTLTTTGQIKYVLFEIFLVSLCPYEYIQQYTFLQYSTMTHSGVITNVNEIMSVASLLKCYFFLRTFMYFSRFNDPRAQRVCQMNGCKATSLFAIKSIIQENPYTLLTGMFLLSSIVGAYAIQVFERPFNIVSGQDFDSYWNAIWLTIVTMTTVGYGDLYPKSFGGRVIGVIICIWGIFITSFFTVTLTNFLSFTPSQNKAYLLLQRLYWKELIQKESVKAVATLYKHKLLSKKQDIFDVNTKIDPKLLSSARTFRRHMVKFKETTRKMFNYNEGNTETQYISKEVERLGCRVDEISDELDDQRKQQNEMNSKIDLILKAIQNNPNYSNTNASSGPFLQTPKGNEHNKSNLNKL
eukprot:403345527